MKDLGTALSFFGAIGFLAAMFLMPTSVASGAYGVPDVVNLSLQQQQNLTAIGCAAVFLAGVVLTAAGAIVEAVAPPLTATLPSESGFAPRSDLARAVETPADEQAAMDRYGIRRDGEGYVFGSFRYTKLNDAIRQAQR